MVIIMDHLKTFHSRALNRIILILATSLYTLSIFAKSPIIIDSSHYSNTFAEIRNYRIFLPQDYYDNPQKHYPVIYFLHGWSQRYFGPVGDNYSNYDKGDENNGDNIANYVSVHDVIVVKPDGFNPSSDTEYELTPYNIGNVKTTRQFPVYFSEFVKYIDASYQTIADREHRAVTGLSMGGFMTYWIAGKYPHLVSAAGNFCGSPEFMAGPLKIPVEYRNIDMYGNYTGMNLRFHYGNRDALRYYHEDMNRIWPQLMDNYDYKIFDAAHSTCGMGEMFDFCLNTFENPPQKPVKWDHIDVYPEFSVWGYNINSNRPIPGFTVLEDVDSRGFKCSVREFLPDGELMPFVSLSVTTPPIYKKNKLYQVNDIDAETSSASQKTVLSDHTGRLKIIIDGGKHHIGINEIKDHPNVSIASVEIENMNWASTNKEVKISIHLLNKGLSRANNVRANLSATRNHVKIINNESTFGNIEVNETEICLKSYSFIVQADSIEISKFRLTIQDENNNKWTEFFELPLKNNLQEVDNFIIADGKTFIVSKAASRSESVFLGNGNGDGVANPGESIVVLLKDMDKLWRSELLTSDKYVNPGGINIRMSDSWSSHDLVGGSAKYSVPLISSDCPDNHIIEFAAEYWTPDEENIKRHIINQGFVKIKVMGNDKTPPILRWVKTLDNSTVIAKVYDGSSIKSVKAKLIPANDVKGLSSVNLNFPREIVEIELLDDGENGDMRKSDNVFSKTLSNQSSNFYYLEIEATDFFGNKLIEKGSEVFLLSSNK